MNEKETNDTKLVDCFDEFTKKYIKCVNLIRKQLVKVNEKLSQIDGRFDEDDECLSRVQICLNEAVAAMNLLTDDYKDTNMLNEVMDDIQEMFKE